MLQTEFRVADAHAYNRRSPARWVASHVLRYWPMATVFLVTTLGMAVAQSLGAVAVGNAFDMVAAGGGPAAVGWAALLVAGAYVGYGGCDIVNSLTLRVLGQRVERDAREELYGNLLGKTPSFHGRQRVGNLMAVATGDVAQVGLMVAPNAGLVAESIGALVVPLVTIALLRAELLLVPALFLASFYVAIRSYNAALRPVAEGQRESYGALNAELAEAVGGIEVVHGFAQEAAEERRFSRNARHYRDLFVREGAIEARYLPFLLYGLAVGLAFGHALWLWSRGLLSVGQVIAYMALLDTLRSPTAFSLATFAQVQLGLASARRLLGLMAEDQGADAHAAGHGAPLRGEITFEGVSFSYDDRGPQTAGGITPDRRPQTADGSPKHIDEDSALRSAVGVRERSEPAVDGQRSAVLRDISFTISPGETVAIVGQTGAGKSTLTKLVNRTLDASRGRVLVDGVDVQEWSLDSLRSQIGTIEQDIFLFSRSIADNIAFGAVGGATREQVEGAAKLAQAHDFISALPAGYDTVVGERGVTLSGGQRQRIAIARAFLADPRILILDDSTSALDSATEDQIQQAMHEILQGRTTLLITHRLSQIRTADRILVLRNGELIAQGAHDDLLATSEPYRKIFVREEVRG